MEGPGTPGSEEFRAAGLYDPDAPGAAERLELLTLLANLGASVEEMVAWGPELPGLVTSLVLRPPDRRLSIAEMADEAGVPQELVERLWRAAGFAAPGAAPVASVDDAELLQLFRTAGEVFGEDTIIQLTRVIGSAAARIAEATVSAFVVNVGAPALRQDPSGLELARANAATADLLPGLIRVFELFVRGHLEASTRPIAVIEGAELDSRRLATGFVDLVGSTALSRKLSFDELGNVLSTFEEQIGRIVAEGGGRLVKTVGDGAMFVADEASAACHIATTAAEELRVDAVVPSVRCGVAVGPVLARDGDYFGPVVSLASRLSDEAPVDSVATTAEVRAEVRGEEGFVFESLGPRRLKGFDGPIELFQVSVAGHRVTPRTIGRE